MNMVEHLDLHADWQERESDRSDDHDERLAAEHRDAWNACVKQRNIDAEIGGGYYADLIEVLNDASSDVDQKINRALMQALVHCAAKGQIEAIEALDQVKDFFITKTLDFHK